MLVDLPRTLAVAVRRRVEDDAVVCLAAAPLALDEHARVLHEPADRRLREARQLRVSPRPGERGSRRVHVRDRGAGTGARERRAARVGEQREHAWLAPELHRGVTHRLVEPRPGGGLLGEDADLATRRRPALEREAGHAHRPRVLGRAADPGALRPAEGRLRPVGRARGGGPASPWAPAGPRSRRRTAPAGVRRRSRGARGPPCAHRRTEAPARSPGAVRTPGRAWDSPHLLRAAARDRELRRPRQGCLARRQHRGCSTRRWAPVTPGHVPLGHRPITGHDHGATVSSIATAEDIDARGLGFVDDRVRLPAHGLPLVVGDDHGFAGEARSGTSSCHSEVLSAAPRRPARPCLASPGRAILRGRGRLAQLVRAHA